MNITINRSMHRSITRSTNRVWLQDLAGKPANRSYLRANEPCQRGSVLSEYVVVLAGLLIVWLGIEAALVLIRQHSDNYLSVMQLIF